MFMSIQFHHNFTLFVNANNFTQGLAALANNRFAIGIRFRVDGRSERVTQLGAGFLNGFQLCCDISISITTLQFQKWLLSVKTITFDRLDHLRFVQFLQFRQSLRSFDDDGLRRKETCLKISSHHFNSNTRI